MAGATEQDESIGALVSRLSDDAKAFVAAEIDLQKAQLGARFAIAKLGLVAGVVALLLVNAAFIALVVGLVLTLSPSIGPGFATLAVVVAALVVAGLLGWVAAKRLGAAFSSKSA